MRSKKQSSRTRRVHKADADTQTHHDSAVYPDEFHEHISTDHLLSTVVHDDRITDSPFEHVEHVSPQGSQHSKQSSSSHSSAKTAARRTTRHEAKHRLQRNHQHTKDDVLVDEDREESHGSIKHTRSNRGKHRESQETTDHSTSSKREQSREAGNREHTNSHEVKSNSRDQVKKNSHHHRNKSDDERAEDGEHTIGKKEIFISAALNEIRIAITEEERLAELFWELPEKERQVGNLYLGKIQRIIQGMNAAFVDIGFKQDAFLHFSDVDEKDEVTDDDDDDDDIRPHSTDDNEPLSKAAASALRKTISAPRNVERLPTFKTKSSGDVKINLTPGQDIIVQVVREAYSSKGFRVSSKISLPGRYMVLLPFSGSVGISKKIRDIKERKRLRTIARSILPAEVGCIVRTEAEDRDDAVLRKDFEELLRLWREVEAKVKQATKPGLVHRDMSMTNSLMRDLLTDNVKRVVVDSKKLYTEIDTYVEWAAPHMRKHIEFYDPIINARQSMFSAVGIEQEIALAVSRKVPLPSGGYLIIEQTEAMVVVDVNSGRFTGEREQEQNSLRINTEAAREVARQLRIRDIGGMVVVDFIDMQDEANRRKLVNDMHRFMRPDRAKFVIYPLTQLGLMQITRQRIRQSISQILSESCASCAGTGIVKSTLVVISDIERWLQKFIASPGREFRIELHVHPTIAKDLTEGTFSKLARLMVKYFVKITLRQDDFLRSDDYRVISIRKQREITNDVYAMK